MTGKKFFAIVVPVILLLTAALYALSFALPAPFCGKTICDSKTGNSVINALYAFIVGA